MKSISRGVGRGAWGAIACAVTLGMPLAAAAQDAALVKKGEGIYTAQKCGVCHSIAGKGGKSGTLDGVSAKLSADDIRKWITHPADMAKAANSTAKPPMPAKWEKLPAADLDALVAYLQSLK